MHTILIPQTTKSVYMRGEEACRPFRCSADQQLSTFTSEPGCDGRAGTTDANRLHIISTQLSSLTLINWLTLTSIGKSFPLGLHESHNSHESHEGTDRLEVEGQTDSGSKQTFVYIRGSKIILLLLIWWLIGWLVIQ